MWNGERSAGDIRRAMPDVTFGAVSLQLRALADAGLVDARREAMWSDALWRLKLQAELDQSRRGPTLVIHVVIRYPNGVDVHGEVVDVDSPRRSNRPATA